MLDVIKYLPLDWRRRNNDCTPKGPKLPSGRPVQCLIGGSLLSFRAPRHKPRRSVVSAISPTPDDELSWGLDPVCLEGQKDEAESWSLRVAFMRCWTFWGPWMTGAKGELSMAAAIVGRQEQYEYQNASFFHPRVFESVLVDYLNAMYGAEELDEPGFPKYQGPVDWKAEDCLPVFSARCKIFKAMRYEEPFAPKSLLLFPITQKHFVQITFSTRIYSEDRSGPLFDTTPITELQESIIDSLQLELGPEAQAEWDRVAADCPDMSLTQHFAPLKWPVDPDDPAGIADDEPDRLTKRA